MRCCWLEKHSLGFDTIEKEVYCKEITPPNSHCLYFKWPKGISIEHIKKNDFLIFLWKQEMGIK